jgi:hypothetical protein
VERSGRDALAQEAVRDALHKENARCVDILEKVLRSAPIGEDMRTAIMSRFMYGVWSD